MQHDNEPPLYRVLFGLIGAVIGGFIVLIIGGHELHVVPMGVSYGDLAAIALTAATVLLAVFGLGAAFASVYGYREFMKRSKSVATSVAEKEATSVANSVTEKFLEKKFDDDFARRAQTIATRILTPEYLQKLITEQIDALAYGSARDDRLDQASQAADSADPQTETDSLDELDRADEADRQEQDDREPPVQ